MGRHEDMERRLPIHPISPRLPISVFPRLPDCPANLAQGLLTRIAHARYSQIPTIPALHSFISPSIGWRSLAAERLRGCLRLHRTDLLPPTRTDERDLFSLEFVWLLVAAISVRLRRYKRHNRQSVLRAEAGLSCGRCRRLPVSSPYHI